MWSWLLCFAAISVLTETFGEQPRLEIQPELAQVIRSVGSSLALTCTPKVENLRLITQLEWRDTKDRRIDATNTEAPLYIQKLNGEVGIVLIFSKLTENLAGNYTCVANYASSQQLRASTKVSAIVDITWVDAPESQYPVLGKKYKIRCAVKANPAPTVNWLKNGEEIDTSISDRYITEADGLTITNVRESDDGVYTCRAVVFNTGHIETKNIKVEVQIPPTIYPMKTIEVVEGEESSAICNGTGKPPPSYTWIKENTRENLSNSDRFTVKQNSGLLVIHRVEMNDNSYYKCIAENPAGRNETRVKITVLSKPKIYELLNATAPVENYTRITCKASGRPAPRITFRKLNHREPFQDGPQQNDPRIRLENFADEEKGETFGTLHINRLRRTDDGLYECIAENKVERAYKNGHITVEFPPTFEKTETENYPEVWSWNDNPGNLTCIAESIPNATIQWRFNGIYIENDRSPNIRQVGNGPISYLVVKPYNEPRFFSTYECIARNKLGENIKKIELKRATVPGHVQEVKPESITATTIKFSIVAPPNYRGLPLRSIIVQYQTERERTWDTAREHFWTFNASYILENLVPEETYNFRFAAKNDVGTGGWAANQQIKMPRRSVPVEPKLIIEGQIPDSSNYVAADVVTTSMYADHYRLQWTVPNDNGDPIDSYMIRFCVTQRVNGVWRDSESECSGEIRLSSLQTSYDMNSLRPDTTYKVEVRAHNAIGLSSPAEVRVRTARGLNSVVLNEGPSISSAMIIGIVVAAIVLVLIIVDLLCCCINRAGILALICDQLKSKPVDEEDPKLSREEKEPLKPDQPPAINGDRCNTSVEYDGRQVYTKPGEYIGKHSVV